METFCEKEKSFNLITHVNVEPAHNSDANALIPAIESAEKRNLKPKELTADSLYGSDDNCERAKAHDVELIAPTMGSAQKGQLSFADFKFSLRGKNIIISVLPIKRCALQSVEYTNTQTSSKTLTGGVQVWKPRCLNTIDEPVSSIFECEA